MGERKLATGKAKKAVAAACQEAVGTMTEAADEAMRVQTPGGVFSVRWDERGSATALGQLTFFAEYLDATGLFDRWLKSCPLSYTSPNAPAQIEAAVKQLVLVITEGRRKSKYRPACGMQNDDPARPTARSEAMQDDPYELRRFVAAQDPVYVQVRAELAAGAKASHWMWFVFPQLKALGRSATAQHYGLASRAEAQAYWRHPLLGARLKECTGLVLDVQGRTAHQIFGGIDELKFRSCMTLFDEVVPEEPAFRQALQKYFGGAGDPKTLELLAAG